MSAALPRAAELGLIGCRVCDLVCADEGIARLAPGQALACPRCGSTMHRRKPASYARTWALLIAAFLMYIPANLLPIMRTASLNDVDDNTILSGVVIVFIASIVVPMLKFLVLGTLLVSCRRHSDWAQPQRARLYRLVELIGYWSMLDVFVVSLLTALVRFKVLSEVDPLPGVIFFGLTVVLTILASMSFDPRLIWDDGITDD
jgi:paraquat-inducible protein A